MALRWEPLAGNTHESITTYRTKVPGGWLVLVHAKSYIGGQAVRVPSVTFYPDPHYLWNGSTLEMPGDVLLRPAQGGPDTPPEELLRPVNDNT